MNTKRVVGRNVAIALGIIAIIFLVGLVGAVVNYTSIINARDNTIASNDNTIASLNGQVSDLQNQVNDLTGIANLAKTATWVSHQTVSQPEGIYSSWNFNAQYAGYIVVTVESATNVNTYVEVKYQSHGLTYDSYRVLLHDGVGSPTFPVLPSTIEIRVGNMYYGATETVTIQYVY